MADYRLHLAPADKIFLTFCNQAIVTFLREINLILLARPGLFIVQLTAELVWLRNEYDEIIRN